MIPSPSISPMPQAPARPTSWSSASGTRPGATASRTASSTSPPSRIPAASCTRPAPGIWQTVWLEAVPAVSIESLKLTPDIDAGKLHVTVFVRGKADGLTVTAAAYDPQRPRLPAPCRSQGAGSRRGSRPADRAGIRGPNFRRQALVARSSVPLRSAGCAPARPRDRSTRSRATSACGRSPWARTRRASRAPCSTASSSSSRAPWTRVSGPTASTRPRPTRPCASTSRRSRSWA